MKVLLKKVNEKPVITDIPNELQSFQDLVGGYIEVVRTGIGNTIMVCDEEGKINQKPVNFITSHEVIVGDVCFCSTGGEDFADITEEQANEIIKRYFSE